MKALLKKHAYWLKWVFSLLLLGVVVFKVDYSQLINGLRTVSWWYYLLAFLNVLLVQTLATLKWNVFLPNHTFKELFILNLIARFYSFALPSTVTGDVVKVMKTDKKGLSTTNIATGVLLDKMLGMLALGLILVVSLYFTPYLTLSAFFYPTAALTLFTLVAFITLYSRFPLWIITKLNSSKIGKWNRINRLLAHLKNTIGEVKGLIKSSRIVGLCLLYSVFYQLSIVISSLILNEIFGLPLTIFEYVILSGVTQLIMLLPISMGGIGIKDVSFVVLMTSLGVSEEISITMTIVNYPILILMVIVGYVVGHFYVPKNTPVKETNSL